MKAAIFTIAFAIALIKTNAGVTADTPWIGLRLAGPFTLSAKQPKNLISIPYTLTNPALQAGLEIAKAKPLYVRLGSSLEKSYQDAFEVSIDKTSSNINFVIDMKMLTVPGTYEVMIIFNSSPEKPTEIPISFTRPAAVLGIDTPFKITIEENLFPGREIHGDPFVISESGGLSNVNQLQLPQPYFTEVKKKGLMKFSEKQLTVPADSYLQAEYTIDKQIAGDLPIGKKITGKLKVSAPELANPVILSIEVIHIRSKWLIVIFVFLGVLSSFLIRTVVRNKRELEEKRILGGQLLLDIRKDMAGIGDEAYKKKVADITRELEQLLLEKSSIIPRKESLATSIVTKTEGTTTAYNLAKAQFKIDCEKAQEDLKKLASIIENPQLPQELKNYLVAADESYKRATADLAVFNPTGVTANIKLAVKDIRIFLEKYHKSITDLIQKAESKAIIPSAAPDTLETIVVAKATEIKTKLPELLPTNEEIDIVDGALKQAIDIHLNTKQMLGLLLEKITVLYNHDQTNDNSPLMNNFRDQFKLWKDAIDRMISTPLEKFDPSVVAALNTAWDAVAQAQQAAGTRMGDPKKKTLTTTAQPGWLQKTMNIFGVPFAKKDFSSDPLEVSIRRAKSNWVFLSVFKTIFIFILLAFAAYNFYDDDFTGTFSQLFGMFVAAFSMDFTIDNVTTFPGKKDNS